MSMEMLTADHSDKLPDGDVFEGFNVETLMFGHYANLVIKPLSFILNYTPY